jgi:TolA-binding protein
MNRRIALAIAFLLATAGVLFAQAISVNYLDGVVEVKTAKGWTALGIGDAVAADATVRITQSGSLELLKGKTRITLLKDGTYEIAKLMAATDKSGVGNTGTVIAQKLQSLTTEKPKTATVGGVRGAAQGTGDVTWVEEGEETRAKVQTLLDQKKYTDAVKALQQAIDESTVDADEQEFTYLMGVAYYGQGQTAKAYRTLLKVTPPGDAAWYARFVILKSQVLVDTQSYQDALAVLTPFISTYPTGEATQVAYLLTSYCQKGLGDAAAARTALDAGYKIDPATDTAKLIDQARK